MDDVLNNVLEDENFNDSNENLDSPVDYTKIITKEMIQFNNGEFVPYKEITIIENNGINVVFNTDSMEYIKELIPNGIINAKTIIRTEDKSVADNETVFDSESGLYNDIILKSISLNISENVVSALLPGVSDAAKQYYNTNQKIEQIEANLDYIAMETGIEL